MCRLNFIKIIIFSFLLIPNLIYGLEGSLNFSMGTDYSIYKELHSAQPLKNKAFYQTAPKFELDAKYYLFDYWLYVGTSVNYAGLIINSNTDDTIAHLNQRTYGGWAVPAKPINISIETEYFFDIMTPNSSAFGYENLSGLKFTAIAHYPFMKGLINIFAIFPFWNSIVGLNEYEAKVTFNAGQIIYPGAPDLTQGLVLSLYYKNFNLTQEGVDDLEINNQTIGLSLGYNW